MSTFLGIVERAHSGVPNGPGARLRPIAEISLDKKRWTSIQEEDFPNSGVVSWWQPPVELLDDTAWLFQVEQSGKTYDPAKRQHDFYRAKGLPTQATEIYELESAPNADEVRQLLSVEGIPIDAIATRRLVFRDRTGAIMGPIELAVADGRLFLGSKVHDVPIVFEPDLEESSINHWRSHKFLIPGWPSKGDKADFSTDELFLKRVFRELRVLSAPVVEDAKLTERLITRYCASAATTSLSPIQRYRLERLNRITKDLSQAVTMSEEVLQDFINLPSVSRILDEVKENAVSAAISTAQGSLDELEKRRTLLEGDVQRLAAEVGSRQLELERTAVRRVMDLKEFDKSVKLKLELVTKEAPSFLADVALLRAALLPEAPVTLRQRSHKEDRRARTAVLEISGGQLISRAEAKFHEAGISPRVSNELVMSLMAGFTPMLFGTAARDSLQILASTIAGGRIYWVTLHPGMVSPEDLKKTPVIPGPAGDQPVTIGDLFMLAQDTQELYILSFEHANLGQIDSVILPILRQYAEFRSNSSWITQPGFPSSLGFFPSGVMLSGLLIDSPMALPASAELWSLAIPIDTDAHGEDQAPVVDYKDQAEGPTSTSFQDWCERSTAAEAITADSSLMFSAYLLSRLHLGPTTRRLIRRLCIVADTIDHTKTSEQRIATIAALAVIPHCISLGIDFRALFEGFPLTIPTDQIQVDKLTTLLRRWGFEVGK